jgi:predicted site-specific integrase-resolvase
MPPKLVPTGVAAQALGVDRGTLVRWWQQGMVTPAVVTPGGHARWDLGDLREQLKALRERDE